MTTTVCPDCHGSGSTPVRDGEAPTWCRTCYGWGLMRLPEDDDELEPPELFWPESIRQRESA
jgi:hypothetical protein